MNLLFEKSKFMRWQSTNRFTIMFTNTGADIGQLSSIPKLDLDASINTITLGDVANEISQEYIADKWVLSTSKEESFSVSIGFKDYNNYNLYRKFMNAQKLYKDEYPDNIKVDIMVYVIDAFSINEYVPLLTYKDCMLEAVSSPSLDVSASASIAEFTVTFKCPTVKLG